VWKAVRQTLTNLLGKQSSLKDDSERKATVLVPRENTHNLLPCVVHNYTDFYASKEHATNMGKMLRPDEASLKPNWVWLPVGYHGRASSVVVSGQSVRRPCGQSKGPNDTTPTFKPCAKLDYELEVAVFVGPPSSLGEPIPMSKANDHIFGISLLNDWTARDFQAWEYVPLGPLTGKNFASTISPWIVTLEALEPFRVPMPIQDPPPLSYLVHKPHPNDTTTSESASPRYAYDIQLQVKILTEKMETGGLAPHLLTNTNFKYMYWSICQQLSHHSVSGCNMQTGDILGSGTISGSNPGEFGSIMEVCWGGKNQINITSTGEQRTFIQDGDTILVEGQCHGDGYCIGFGDCLGKVTPALPSSYWS